MADFDKPMVVIITGANRGYGKALCSTIISELQSDSVMILVGRTQELLEATKNEISHLNSSVTILIYYDFECTAFNTRSLITFFDQHTSLMSALPALLLIHNAGTVGEPSQKSIAIDLPDVSEYMTINFSSMVAANSVVLERFAPMEHKAIVNVSSLAAVQPLKSLSLYCAGKAARDMFFKVVASENPSFRVLNYAPGPMDTPMAHKVKDTSHDDEIRTMYASMPYVDLIKSAKRLVAILRENKFTSGDHIDFYDPLPGSSA